MTSNKKNVILLSSALLILLFILYYMFKDNYRLIWEQLKQTNIWWFCVIVLMGICYQIFDAYACKWLVRRYLPVFSHREALEVIFIGVFFNISTLGMGIKPGQAYYLHEKGIGVGKAFSITTLPYVFHKFTIMLFASLILIIKGGWLKATFIFTGKYLLSGYLLSAVIIIFIILLYTCVPFGKFIFLLADKLFADKKWNMKKENAKKQMEALQLEAKLILKERLLIAKIIGVDFIKMAWWYVIPYISLWAVDASINTTIIEVISISAFMQLIIGVIPNAGGMISAEVVYMLLFGVYFGEVTAGSTMILYRLATYYIPFLISIFAMLLFKRKIKLKRNLIPGMKRISN